MSFDEEFENEFDEKRYPVIKMDGHYCLLTIDKRPLTNSDLPSGLHYYDLRKSEKTEGPLFRVEDNVPDLYRWGRIICREELPLDEKGGYIPASTSALYMPEPPTMDEFGLMSEESLADSRDNGLLYLSSFGLIPVYPSIDVYKCDNSIYLGLDFYDEEEQMMDHFASVTVNLEPLPYSHAAIDTNNNGDKVVTFLEREGFGEKTGRSLSSGFCSYPVFHFEDRMLQAIDPEVYKMYAKLNGREAAHEETVRLDEKIQNASERVTDHFVDAYKKSHVRD